MKQLFSRNQLQYKFKIDILIFNMVLFMASFIILGNTGYSTAQEAIAEENASQSANGHGKSENTSHFAVVELFTSQGCSSCPPADRNLQEIYARAETEDQNVYVLSFHVDYWDYLGWKDPYSSSANSDRQRQYARQFQSSRIYTPQMIVNGNHEFVGSRKSEAREAINKALAVPQNTQVRLNGEMKSGSDFLAIQYTVSGNLKNTSLNLAVVEKSVETDIKRGENSGRKLQHSHVVRAFKTIVLDQSDTGIINIRKPADLDANEAIIIGYVQQNATMHIVGAGSYRFSETE